MKNNQTSAKTQEIVESTKRNKKILLSVIAVLLITCVITGIFIFAGCKKKKDKSDDKEHDKNVAAEQQKEVEEEEKEIVSTPLDQIAPYNGVVNWNTGNAADYDGNDFTKVCNYTILHAGWHRHSGNCSVQSVYSVEYKLDKKYQTLSFQLSPYNDVTEGGGGSYVKVFSNGVLRYISTDVSQKSGVVKVENVDISDTEFLRIEVTVQPKRCIMLSDVTLNTVSPFNSKIDPKKVSLSTLNAFNGGFSFNTEYPVDIFGNSYNNTTGYTYLHAGYHRHSGGCSVANTHSAEYHVEKKYKTLTMDIAPCQEFDQNANTSIKIFVDDELKYTSPVINQKTKKFNIGEIDISNAEYIKIVADVSAKGCVILSDVMLTKK